MTKIKQKIINSKFDQEIRQIHVAQQNLLLVFDFEIKVTDMELNVH